MARFDELGFVRINGAFPQDAAAQMCARLWTSWRDGTASASGVARYAAITRRAGS